MMKSGLLGLLLVVCLSSHLTLQACAYSNNELWLASNNCSELLGHLDIPADIKVPSGQKLQVAYYAKGLQHYSFNGSTWVVFNATADLYSMQGGGAGHKVEGGGHKQVVGQHFFLGQPDAAGGQPSWETSVPAFSLVTARSLRQVTVDPNSITWNLFQATYTNGSKDLLGAVTYLQRLASKGGLPPSTTMGAKLGDVHLTPYSIIYAFYTKAEY